MAYEGRLKEPLDKHGLKPEPVVRKALEEEVRRRPLSSIEEIAEGLSERVSRIPGEEVAELVRRGR
jgi:hypothetical protein